MLMCLIAQVTTVKLWLADADVNLLCTYAPNVFFSTKMDIGSGVCTFGILYT